MEDVSFSESSLTLLSPAVYNAIKKADNTAIMFPKEVLSRKGKFIITTPKKPVTTTIKSLLLTLNLRKGDIKMTKKGEVETRTVASIIVVV